MIHDVKFRLIYEGRLPSAGRGETRTDVKHEIRQHFHPQLKTIWSAGTLSRYLTPGEDGESVVDRIGGAFNRCGHRFVPLVLGAWSLTCELDILFLRRDMPGSLVRSGGDIDNRIKVLLDALKVPDGCVGIPETPGEDENPFFCLLEDDKYITRLNVETDQLLTPVRDGDSEQDVKLVISVETKVIDEAPWPIGRYH